MLLTMPTIMLYVLMRALEDHLFVNYLGHGQQRELTIDSGFRRGHAGLKESVTTSFFSQQQYGK